MNIIHKSIYIINYETQQVILREPPATFDSYVAELINHISNNTSVREYKTHSDSTEVISCILKICANQTNENSVLDRMKILARRLLLEETKAQIQIRHTNLTTYTRALRTLIEKELVSVKHRTRGGQQITSHIQPRMEGFKLHFPRYLISELRDTAFLVYVELLNRCGKESWSLSRRVLAKKFHCSALTISRAIRQLKERNLIDAVPDYDRQGINRFRALSLHERVARLKRQHSRTMLFFYQMHKLVLERKKQRTAALKRRYAYSLFAAPLSSMHLLFPIPRCFISKERKNKSLPLAKSNSLMGLLRRKAMDRARSPMVEFSG